MPAMAELCFGGAKKVGSVPVGIVRERLLGVARYGEGLVCDRFEVSLRGVSTIVVGWKQERTMACAFVVQALRNSIRETAALYGTCRWCPRRICSASKIFINSTGARELQV
jgi:hypothetical protein